MHSKSIRLKWNEYFIGTCRTHKSVVNLEIPLVVRLEGTNVDNAKQILKDSGLPIQSAVDLDDAAKKATAALK